MVLSLFIALFSAFLYLGLEIWPLFPLLFPSLVKAVRGRRYLLFSALLSSALSLLLLGSRCLDLCLFSSGFESADIAYATGHAVSDDEIGKFSRRSVVLRVEEVNLKMGDVASARGLVRISFPSYSHIYSGDLVKAEGSFSSSVFNARRVRVLKRSTLADFRRRVSSLISSRFSEDDDVERLEELLLLGRKRDLEDPLSELARRSGTSYILALSGMHISLFSFLFALVLSPLFGRRAGRCISLSLLLLYVIVIGPKPSLMRALLLSLVLFLLPSLESIEALYFTLFLQCLFCPESLPSLSSCFSYLSLAGILGLGPVLRSHIENLVILPLFLVSTISASVSALVYTIPLTLSVFKEYTLSSILAGPIAAALVYLFMLLSILSLVLPLPDALLLWVYRLLEKVLSFGAQVGMHEDFLAYLLLLCCILCLVVLSTILSQGKESDVESQL